jgi:calcineurin-like phosphoesterase family protein
MTVFFTSDTHFGHKNILHLGDGRPFKDIDHHDAMLIANWHETVTADDMVIHLGDVAMGPWPEGLMKMKGLPGFKVLVPGNHDRVSSLESEARRDRFMDDYLEVFDEVWNETEQFSIGNQMFVLSHYPYTGDHTDKDRHVNLRPTDQNVPLIHGHTHQTEQSTFSKKGTPMLSVGVDANGFTPVSGEEILRRYEKALKSSTERGSNGR